MMRLVLRSLLFHWRGNLPVLLGAAVGAAVMAGALLVGDSLRGSLRERTERQLGLYPHVLIGNRFFREEIVSSFAEPPLPVILLQGSVRTRSESPQQVNKVTVLGIEAGFGLDPAVFETDANGAIVSYPLAQQLQIQPADRILLSVQKGSAIPRSSVLGRRSTDEATQSITLNVSAILPPDHPANDFSLSPNPATPFNLFVPRKRLQKEVEQPKKINALFASQGTTESLTRDLKKGLELGDWGLSIKVAGKADSRYVSLESGQLLLEPYVVDTAKKVASSLQLRSAPTYVYLVNRITVGSTPTPPATVAGAVAGNWTRLQEIPYSVVAALDPGQMPPLGPFLPDPSNPLQEDEIVLTNWSNPTLLGAEIGKPITLTFFKPEIEGRIEETTKTFKLRGFIPLQGPASDPNLTPNFPGITDKLTLATWDPPFPYDSSRVGPRDELFWNRQRTTPKGYITLKAGQDLWGSRFGNTTSIRLASNDKQDLQETAERFSKQLQETLQPEKGSFQFEPLKERFLEAGKGSTDFGLLFVAFSFFLIGAALLLVALLFRLNLERRASEIGLLLANGYPYKTVRNLLLIEGLILSILGSVFGLLAAVLYADGMIRILVELWPSEGVRAFLKLHVGPLSLIIGFVVAVLMSQLAIWWAVRGLSKVPTPTLLHGETVIAFDALQSSRSRWVPILIWGSLIGAMGLAILAPSMPPGEPQAGTFFGSGMLLLTAGLAWLWKWMKKPHTSAILPGPEAMRDLGLRNLTRQPTRSLLTAGLIASASFLLVAVESFRRQPDEDFAKPNGGSGGFALMAESDVPIHVDLLMPDGQSEILDGLQRFFQDQVRIQPNGPSVEERKQTAEKILQQTEIFSFRRRGGDDASCLNLYQATRPRILGVPDKILAQGGFRFSSTQAKSEADQANPWLLLQSTPTDGSIPCFVEENTAMWQLKKGLGDTIEIPDEDGVNVSFRLVGFLKDSMFQSELLIADAAFRKLYPHEEGFSTFLIRTPKEEQATVQSLLNSGLAAYGMNVTTTKEKVAAYLAVQNTYLSTFQLLGGFGLLLGVVGLAVVLLRSVWERRAELALLRAVGFRGQTLSRLVLVENVWLFLLGLGIGILAAFLSILPHLTTGVPIPWLRLTILLGLVLLVGLLVVRLSVTRVLTIPLIPALKKE